MRAEHKVRVSGEPAVDADRAIIAIGVLDLVEVEPQNIALGFAVLALSEEQDIDHDIGAGIVAKTVRTAVANAENTQSVDVDRLFVKQAQVDEGGMWKRFTSRAQGRATRVRKRLSHITIVLDEAEERS